MAQEFASRGDRNIFAATLPLMASKFVLSDTASRNTVVQLPEDFARAFLYGLIEEEIYIELPDEDIWKMPGFVGKIDQGYVWNKNIGKGGEMSVSVRVSRFRACIIIKIAMCSLWFTWTTSCVQEKQET